MPISIEDVRANIVPESGQAEPAQEQRSGRPFDMDRVTRELRRTAERLARLTAD
jgi:hypothetical protein